MRKNRFNLIENTQKTFGKNLRGFTIGKKIKHWPGKTITESDNNIFSMITMNHHPLHIDKIFAKKQKHKKIIINGTLVFSLVVGMTVKDISGQAIANLSYQEVEHLNPVFINDTLYAFSQIISVNKTSKKNRSIIEIFTYANNQKGKKVISFKRKILIKNK